MSLTPRALRQYHVFLASPGDVGAERQYVRRFFDDYNHHTAHIWQARFEVIDWENYGTIGVGRPQELINQQTLEKYRDSLALVIGITAQRFGTPSGKAESGTKEEFDIAMASQKAKGFPEIKWFFRKIDKLELPTDPEQAMAALAQWQQVLAFRKEMQDLNNPVFYTQYPGAAGFAEVFERDLNQWLADPARPWAAERVAQLSDGGGAVAVAPLVEFDAERYRATLLKRFDKLNFEMLDTTGAFYSGVRLWSVFVPQSARECHEYNPRLLEIPKEHQQRLLKAGEINAAELAEAERQADRQRQEYFRQPLRPVLDVVDDALGAASSLAGQKLVILGDPGSGKSSLVRFLALRWARVAEPAVRDTQPIPLMIDLREYSRWQCDGRKGFVRFLEEAPVWYDWSWGLLDQLLAQPGRVVLLLDGLDEIFDVQTREAVINDIQRFSSESAHTPVVVTSRVVGYQPQRLRDGEFRHFMLQDLDADQIAAFVDRWHEETFDSAEQAAPKRDRLRRVIHDSKSIAMLAGNPLLLTMMAILNRNQELPRDRADLYSQASRVLLHQWDTERALVDFPGLSAEIGMREKTDILRRVASHMQAGPGGLKGNLVDGTMLCGLIEAYMREELHFDQARAAARSVVDQLRLRNFVLCFAGANSYAFVHRTFLEYFCAADFVHRFNVAKTLDIDGLIALFDDHCRQDEWHEVLRLICGQIDESFVGRIVERLATRTDLEKWECETPLPELPLAIGCLAEVRNPAKIASTADVLLESLIRCASSKGERGLDYFLREKILPASQGLGERWPTCKPLSERAFEIAESMAGWGDRTWPEFLATVDPNRSVFEQFQQRSKWPLRASALRALADKWPDEATRALLEQRTVEDDHYNPRSAALQVLADKWPDEATRALLEQRAVLDGDYTVRYVALRALAGKWPDEATRALLEQRTVRDDHYNPRSAALQVLADKWPDEATRALLEQRAVVDDSFAPRRAALQALAARWPDEATRALLEQRAVQDQNETARQGALKLLARGWPDEATRALLEQRAVQDHNETTRHVALQALADKWPDEATRALLAQRALLDDNYLPRYVALKLLADKWPDEVTRALLEQRAVLEDHDDPRYVSLQALADEWPDQATRPAVTVGRPG
jgi:NACHT domain